MLAAIPEYYCSRVMEGEGVIGTGNSEQPVSLTCVSLSPHFELLCGGVLGGGGRDGCVRQAVEGEPRRENDAYQSCWAMRE